MNETKGARSIDVEFRSASKSADEPNPGNTLRNSIRNLLGVSPGLNGYRSYDELSSSLSASDFRRAGLLGVLNVRFDGNIADTLRFAYPDLFKKPILDLDHYDPQDPVQATWRKKFDEIEQRTIATMVRGVPRYLYYLKGSDVASEEDDLVDHNDKNARKKVVKRSTREHNLEKRDFIDWWTHEVHDLTKVLDRFVKPGDSAVSFLSGHDAVLPSLILGKVGQEGNLSVVSSDAFFEEELPRGFLRLLVNLQDLKGEERGRFKTNSQVKKEKAERTLSGSIYIDSEFRAKARRFLSWHLRENPDSYFNDNDWQRNVLMTDFFNRFNTRALRYSPPELPQEIDPVSQDVIVEQNRFAEIDDEHKEQVLYELDRVLKTGGYLIFRESTLQQTLIEYYGEELFQRKYQRVNLKGINSAQIMVYRKGITGPSKFKFEGSLEDREQDEQDGFCTKSHGWFTEKDPDNPEKYTNEFYQYALHLIRKKHRIDGVVFGELPVDETLKEELSLSWFRKVRLLKPLLVEFGGDINKAVDFVVDRYTAERQKASQENHYSDKPLIPDNSKESYSIEDLAKDLGVSVGAARSALEKSGIKTRRERRTGQSAFGSKAQRAKRLTFSPQDYPIAKEFVKQQLSQNRGGEKNG